MLEFDPATEGKEVSQRDVPDELRDEALLWREQMLDAVYDITIAYPDFTPDLPDCFAAKVRRIDVHVERHPISTLSTDEAELSSWVFDRFVEKDERLAEFAASGRLPGTPWPDRVRTKDWFVSERRRESSP